MTMAEAMHHEVMAGGPAMGAAVSARKSHPDPMMDPSEAHIRPRRPTSRLMPSRSSWASWPCVAVIAVDPFAWNQSGTITIRVLHPVIEPGILSRGFHPEPERTRNVAPCLRKNYLFRVK